MNLSCPVSLLPEPGSRNAVPGNQSKSRRFSRWLALGILSVSLLPVHAQLDAPSVIGTTPEEGGEFEGILTVIFSTDMADSIAITFSAGEWDCHWQKLLPSLPNMFLECVPTSALPPGTITYTLNPDGSGFESVTGDPLPTTTGSFVVPDNGGGDDLTVTPSPADGGDYCANDGPVTFTFNLPMKDNSALEITPGTWHYGWSTSPGVDNPVFACTPLEDLVPGQTYTWSLNPLGMGFESESGKILPLTTGSFTIREDCDDNGGGDKPPSCPEDNPPLPLPKTLFLCGDLGVWEQAAAIGMDDGSFLVYGSYAELGDYFDTLGRMNAQGVTQWRVAATDPLTRLNLAADEDHVLATRDNEAVSQLDIGVFDASTLTPVFRKRFNQTAPNAEVIPQPDGQIFVLQTFNDHLELAVLTASGNLAWARRYNCPDFVLEEGGFPGLADKSNCELILLNDGMALAFTKSETDVDGADVKFSQTFIWMRLNSDGSLRWAKKYANFDAVSAPTVWSEEDGSFLITLREGDMSDPDNFSFNTRILKMDANGNLVWGRLFTGVNLYAARTLPSGQFLLDGTISETAVETEKTDAILAILDATGHPVAQTRLDKGDSDIAMVVQVTDHLYLGFISSTIPQIGMAGVGTQAEQFTQTVYVGRADLQLQNFQWRKYQDATSFGGLFPSVGGGPLLFCAFSQETHELDMFTVNDDLTPNTPCSVFETEGPTQKAFELTGTDVTASGSTPDVTTSSITPTLSPGDITLQTYTWAEQPLCSGQEPPVTPATLTIQAGENGVTVSFATVAGQQYTLQKSTHIQPASWQNVETMEGTGAPVSRTYPAGGETTFFRVLTSRD